MGIDPVSLAITVALNAAMMAVTMSQTIEGPRTADLTATVADYGTPLNNFYGTRRLEVPVIYAESIREEKVRRKTKGGKYNEYVYYGTWAVAIAEHQVDSVLRVWFDRHLVYDGANTGPTSVDRVFNSLIGTKTSAPGAPQLSGKNYRFYDGSESQLPDPRIQQKVDADEGDGSTPAYRGVSYIMFEEVPLEKFGNRHPQVSVEAARETDQIWPTTDRTASIDNNRLHRTQFSQDFSRMYISNGTTTQIWDLSTQTIISEGPTTTAFTQAELGGSLGTKNGKWRVVTDTAYAAIGVYDEFGLYGSDVVYSNGVNESVGGVQTLIDGAGNEHWITQSVQFLTSFYHNGTLLSGNDIGPGGLQCSSAFVDLYGDVWCVMTDFGTMSAVYFYRIVEVSGRDPATNLLTVTLPAPLAGNAHYADAIHYRDADVDHFVFHVDTSYVYAVDIATQTITIDGTGVGMDVYNNQKQWALHKRGLPTLWLNFNELDLKTLTVLRTQSVFDWDAPVRDADGVIYDPINHALICWPQYGGYITWRYLDRPASQTVLLSTIMSDIAGKAGLDANDYDASALTQTIDGFSWTMGPASDIAGSLLELYDSDVRPHDAKVEFLQRGGSSSSTIAREYMARKSNEDPLVKTSLIPDVDLPYRIFLNFADVDKDQTPNTAVAQRSAESVYSLNELPIDMTTLALATDDADALTKRALRVRWFERTIHELKITPLELAMEPGDVHTLEVSGDEFTARLIKMNIEASGFIDTKWVNTDPSIHTMKTGKGATMTGRADSVLLIPGLSEGFVIDAPLVTDADDQTSPLLYVAAAPYDPDSFYSGTEIARSDSGDELDAYIKPWDSISTTATVTWGLTLDALPDAVENVWDRGSVLTVEFKNGTPTSYTEDEILENETINLCAIGKHETGWEYIQFATATLISGTTYELTNLIRGVRGTEQFMGNHQLADRLVFLNIYSKTHTVPISEFGDTNYYRAVTNGRGIDSAASFSFEFTAASHKPYAPAQVKIVQSGADYDFTWIRRTRIGGNLIDGRDVSLGETSESYKVLIMDGSTIVRTITATSETATYTEAQQIADWGSAQDTLNIRVAQVSPALSIDGYYTEAFRDYGEHLYWRIFVEDNWGDGTGIVIQEVEFLFTRDGSTLVTGGAAFGSDDATGNEYAKAFDGVSSSAWYANSAPIDQYIGYEFASPARVKFAALSLYDTGTNPLTRMPKNFRLEYSDDGVDYTTAFTDAVPANVLGARTVYPLATLETGYHRMYRLLLGAQATDTFFQFFDIEFRATAGGTDQTVAYSSNNGSSVGHVIFDQELTGNEGYKGFNGGSSSWASYQASAPHYIGWVFADPVVVTEIVLTGGTAARGPTDITFQYSDDGGITWETQTVIPTLTWSASETKTITV